MGPSVRIATTSDPRHDWCAINRDKITGVVDVGVKEGEKWLLLGEIESGTKLPFIQIVAAAAEDGHWPCGEVFSTALYIQHALHVCIHNHISESTFCFPICSGFTLNRSLMTVIVPSVCVLQLLHREF